MNGKEALIGYEYFRRGVCNVFMVSEPLTGKGFTKVTEQKTKKRIGPNTLNE